MAHQGYDLSLSRYADEGWRATFYNTDKEHSYTASTGSAWEPTPWRAVQGRRGAYAVEDYGRDAALVTGSPPAPTRVDLRRKLSYDRGVDVGARTLTIAANPRDAGTTRPALVDRPARARILLRLEATRWNVRLPARCRLRGRRPLRYRLGSGVVRRVRDHGGLGREAGVNASLDFHRSVTP